MGLSEKKTKTVSAAAVLIFTGTAVWLLYPVITAGSISAAEAESFFYRSVSGFVILIILFGKSLYDLFFPSPRKSWLDKTGLIIYSVIIGFSLVVLMGKVLMAVLSDL